MLTEHFSLSEFELSSIAQAHGLDNSVPENLIPNLQNLCEQILEPLRQHVGVPVVITSGYRCPELNRLVGGVPNSQHLLGEAADIVVPPSLSSNLSSLSSWFYWLLDNTHFDQLGFEQSGSTKWIHVSCKLDPTQNRQSVFQMKK